MTNSSTELFDACRQGDLATVESIYNADPPIINTEDEKGFTPLIIAVYNNHHNVAAFLLEKGANPDMTDLSGNSALMGVCFKGYTDIANILLAAGASVNQRNANGATALTFAVTFGHLPIAQLLLQKGADVALQDTRGKSPLDYARAQQNAALVNLLERYRPQNQQPNATT